MALEEKGDRKPSQFSVDKNVRTVRKALPCNLLLASSKRKVSHLFEESPGAKKHLFAGLDVTDFCGRHFKHARHYVKQRHSSSVLLYVHSDHKDCQGRGAQDGHLNFHTAPELCRDTILHALCEL